MAGGISSIRRKALAKLRKQRSADKVPEVEIPDAEGEVPVQPEPIDVIQEETPVVPPSGQPSFTKEDVERDWAALVKELAFFIGASERSFGPEAQEKAEVKRARPIILEGGIPVSKDRSVSQMMKTYRRKLIGSAVRLGELKNILALERKARAKDADTAKGKLEAVERHWRKKVKHARTEKEERFLQQEVDKGRFQSQVRWLQEELADARRQLREIGDGTRQRGVPSVGPSVEGTAVGHQEEVTGMATNVDATMVPEQARDEITRLQGEIGALKINLQATRKDRDELACLHQESLVLLRRAEEDRDFGMARAEREVKNVQITGKLLADQRAANKLLASQLEGSQLVIGRLEARLRLEEDMSAERKQVAYYKGFEECRLLAI